MPGSTDDKLLTLLNARQVNDEEESYLIEEERRARIRLRRASLYGSGAKARIPKVKKEKKYDMSPFELPTVNDFGGENIVLHSQMPPASHMDQYRLVTNNTAKSRADPDRIFYTTSSATEGIVTVEQPPWYFGNNNKVDPPDNNLANAASRYGFRGARDIAQYRVSTNPVQSAQNTRTSYTPAFLKNNDNIIDEWVPQIQAAPSDHIDYLKSPKMWPENTRYTEGFKAKEYPRSDFYKRETTVALNTFSERPKTSSRLEGLLRKSMSEKESLNNLAKMESCKTFESLPITSQDIFRDAWAEKVHKYGTNSLKQTIRDDGDRPIYEPHTLMDPSDTLKYLGSSTTIVHTQTNEEMKFRMQMQKANTSINFAVRWKQTEFFFKGIKAKLKKDRTIDDAIIEIAKKLKDEAFTRGSPTSLKLSEFVPCAQKISEFDGFSQKHFIQLFSAFDSRKIDTFRYVEFISSLTIYTNPHADTAKKLLAIWRLCEEYGTDMKNLDIALAVLSCCCANDNDKMQIEKLFKESFRPTCYRMSARGEDLLIKPLGAGMNNSNEQGLAAAETSNNKENTPGKMRRIQSANATTRSGNEETKKKAPNLINASAQYNIGDKFLEGGVTFLRVVEKCPMLVEAFDKMLSRRLIAMFGNDPRVSAVQEVKVAELPENTKPNVTMQQSSSSINLQLRSKTLGSTNITNYAATSSDPIVRGQTQFEKLSHTDLQVNKTPQRAKSAGPKGVRRY